MTVKISTITLRASVMFGEVEDAHILQSSKSIYFMYFLEKFPNVCPSRQVQTFIAGLFLELKTRSNFKVHQQGNG